MTDNVSEATMSTPDPSPAIKRIDVAVTPSTVDAIQVLMVREGVTLTEAVRRLIGYGELVYRTTRIDGGKILSANSSGSTHEVILVD
jgi:hypothetical protein